jgi:hypothetical protein
MVFSAALLSIAGNPADSCKSIHISVIGIVLSRFAEPEKGAFIGQWRRSMSFLLSQPDALFTRPLVYLCPPLYKVDPVSASGILRSNP